MARTFVVSLLVLIATAAGCGRIRATGAPEARVFRVASSSLGDSGVIQLDSTSLRPVPRLSRSVSPGRLTIFTSFQGSRYHPESVRAITEDSTVLAQFGRAFARVAPPTEILLIDVQDMSPDDIPRVVSLLRTVGDAARSSMSSRVGVVVPSGDTVAYPTRILARSADLIVVRANDQHRPGTRPGPLVTPELITRALGLRSPDAGASRLGIELPLYGYVWNRDDSVRVITFREANARVIRESGTFTRDPSSQFLTATGRDGWTIWVPDSRTVQFMITAALKRGVNMVALAGASGADPAIFREIAATR